MYRIALALIFLIVACTKHQTAKPRIVKNLELKSINNRCLDLQSLVSQFNDPGLELPGLINTKNFKVLSGGNSPTAQTLVLRSLRLRPSKGLHLGELRGLQQADCETVTIPDPIGKPVRYKITEYTKERLVLELQPEALSDASLELHPSIASGFKKFPVVRKYEVSISNPSRMDLAAEYTTVPADCPNARSLVVREELAYRWADSNEAQVRMDQDYFERLKSLGSVPVVTNFGLSPSTSNEIALTMNDALELQKQLQASAHVTCN